MSTPQRRPTGAEARGSAPAGARPREPSRGEDAPPAAAEADSPARALGALGSAHVRLVRVLFSTLGRLVRSLWKWLPGFVRLLLIWIGAPVAAGVFGVSVAYHLLGAHSMLQTEKIGKAKARVKKLTAERNDLKQELEEARTEATQARTQADSAAQELARLQAESAELRRAIAQAEKTRRAESVKTAAVSPTTLKRTGSTAPAKSAAAPPCELSNKSGEFAARLDECMKAIAKPGAGPRVAID